MHEHHGHESDAAKMGRQMAETLLAPVLDKLDALEALILRSHTLQVRNVDQEAAKILEEIAQASDSAQAIRLRSLARRLSSMAPPSPERES